MFKRILTFKRPLFFAKDKSGANVLSGLQSFSNKVTIMAYNVVHIKESNEFAITIINDSGGEEKAMLQYEFIKPNIVDLYHTEVPPVFRGKGIAKILAKEAIEHFMKEDVQLKLSCTYLQKYVDDNPKPEYSNGKIIF